MNYIIWFHCYFQNISKDKNSSPSTSVFNLNFLDWKSNTACDTTNDYVILFIYVKYMLKNIIFKLIVIICNHNVVIIYRMKLYLKLLVHLFLLILLIILIGNQVLLVLQMIYKLMKWLTMLYN